MRLIKIISLIATVLLVSCTSQEKVIGIQLYSLCDDVNTLGIESVLDTVAQMGYRSIELAGYADGKIYGMEPMAFKKMAESKGLAIRSSHMVRFLSNQPELDLAYWKEAIERHAEIGVEYLIMSTLPYWEKETYTREEAQTVCDYFNQIGEIAADYGVHFGFHNHNHEFNIMVEGQMLYEILMEELDPQLVFMQMDVYWVTEAGQDPVALLQQYPGRYPLLHIKDDNVIGESGKISFAPIFDAAYKQGMKSFFVEIESYKYSPIEDAHKSFDYLNKASFVK